MNIIDCLALFILVIGLVIYFRKKIDWKKESPRTNSTGPH